MTETAGVSASWRAAAADLFLGSRCAGCGRPGSALCLGCQRGLPSRPGLCWPDPPPPTLAVARVSPYAAADYADLVRRLVVSFKDEGRADLGEPLGRMLAAVVEHLLLADLGVGGDAPGPVELVPVPSPSASVRRRGRDPVADLARTAARLLRRRGQHVRVVRRLAHGRTVRDQAGLSATDRAANLRGALRVVSVPATMGAAAVRLVVDDVLTTGATADESVRVLLAAGWPVRAVATVAATRRRRPAHRTAAALSPTGRGR